MSILLENLTKRYGTQAVVRQVSIEIPDGELFVLLGASGSGKSTILRMVAGLATCDEGRVLLKGRDVTHLAPQARGTGFVFQNYSIFRHMTLAENIEFGLKIRNMAAAERAKRCEELLDLVGLAGFGDRYAHQISGGQQQRVALARALAYEPSVLLLDEPLGALDAKIRIQLRRSLKEIQRRLRVTTLLVTHDQDEAYEMADRIGVMERGSLLEVGPAERLYSQPRTLYVAGFLGTGTILGGRALKGEAHFGPVTVPIPAELPHDEGASVELLFRPEQVTLSAEQPGPAKPVLGTAEIVEQTFSGALKRVRLRLPRLAGTRQITPPAMFGESGLMIEACVPAGTSLPEKGLWVSLEGWTILAQAPSRLLVVDGGVAGRAHLELARSLAERMGASVVLLGLDSQGKPNELRTAIEQRGQEAGFKEIETHVASGKPAQQIAAQSANSLFEVILIPRRLEPGKTDLDQDVVTFVESADIPVILASNDGKADLSRVLICTRAGEPGKNDILLGGRFARHLGAKVTLLHINRPGREIPPWVRRHLEKASATLRALDVENEILTLSSTRPADGILRVAAEQDLVVIGGHGTDTRSVFGRDNITLQIMTRARCPVLVVPSSR